MEIGNQIKALRQTRGITQETLAEKLGVSAQAVSKWERNSSTPDIQMLPDLSAFFGVTIDQLFALSDETRLERIQNMVWDERVLDPAVVEAERGFLLDMARREPEKGRPYELLAEMENHLAKYHRERAAEYAKTALSRDPELKDAHCELTEAMDGDAFDWYYGNHHKLIEWYKCFVKKNPTVVRGYLWLLDQLMDDYRFEEAREYIEKLACTGASVQTALYTAALYWYEGNREKAHELWSEMEERYADNWEVFYRIAEFKSRECDYEGAKEYFRKSFSMMERPKWLDPLDAIAQLCEMMGDISGAVETLEEILLVSREDWGSISGESVDQYRREIRRLKELL